MNFVEQAALGLAPLDGIDDAVEKWHNGDGPKGQALHTYLGMSKKQYVAWVARPDELQDIVALRIKQMTFFHPEWFKAEFVQAFQSYFLPITGIWVLLRHGPSAAKAHVFDVFTRRVTVR